MAGPTMNGISKSLAMLRRGSSINWSRKSTKRSSTDVCETCRDFQNDVSLLALLRPIASGRALHRGQELRNLEAQSISSVDSVQANQSRFVVCSNHAILPGAGAAQRRADRVVL